MANCSAIIGNGDVSLFSNINISQNGMIYGDNSAGLIVDNIKLD
jgi:hypothetical protein